MDLEVAKSVINHYMELDDGFEHLQIEFFGGEPMLAFNRIKEIVEWVNSRKWRKTHLFDICTNATILTHEMKKWLLDNRDRVIVGFSLDGNRTSHNLTRDSSYNKVNENMPFYLENWPKQFVKMTISAENMRYVAESIIELEEKGIPFTANIVFENIWGTLRLPKPNYSLRQ
jgi:uncharacterized protein